MSWWGALGGGVIGTVVLTTGLRTAQEVGWTRMDLPLLLGTIFTGRLIAETTVGQYPAVVPTLSGQAWITGFASYVVDPDDPFPEGFTVGDIW